MNLGHKETIFVHVYQRPLRQKWKIILILYVYYITCCNMFPFVHTMGVCGKYYIQRNTSPHCLSKNVSLGFSSYSSSSLLPPKKQICKKPCIAMCMSQLCKYDISQMQYNFGTSLLSKSIESQLNEDTQGGFTIRVQVQETRGSKTP